MKATSSSKISMSKLDLRGRKHSRHGKRGTNLAYHGVIVLTSTDHVARTAQSINIATLVIRQKIRGEDVKIKLVNNQILRRFDL